MQDVAVVVSSGTVVSRRDEDQCVQTDAAYSASNADVNGLTDCD